MTSDLASLVMAPSGIDYGYNLSIILIASPMKWL